MQEIIILEYKNLHIDVWSGHMKREVMCVKEAFLDYVHTEQ